MPRRKVTRNKETIYDAVYSSSHIAKLINGIMLDGKKSVAEKIVYGSMEILKEKLKEDPLKIVLKAIENVRPQVETRSRRVGGATYQVPMDVRKDRSYALGIRWVIANAKSRGGKSFIDKLVAELMDAYNQKGGAMKKRETVHKMAESNRAFAHYKW